MDALNDSTAVDVVQPMKSGWWIYVQTTADCERLVAQGIIMAGKHVPLRSELVTSRKRTVKIMVHDLPLHTVDNEQVLEAISESFAISSEVLYGTLWQNGQPTSIRNGDHYLYIAEDVAAAMPAEMTIAGFDV